MVSGCPGGGRAKSFQALKRLTIVSTFTWLAHSETERQKALDVINLFREKTTRDELGIGHVRDTFSDLLFPGTSTIQTRARYFLFLPWIYRDLEDRGVGSDRIADRARRHEVKLIYALERGGETEGVVGIEAKDSLKRFPSSIYWNGLAVWRIRLFSGSRGQYFRSLSAFQWRRRRWESTEADESDTPPPRNWHPGVPDPPEGYLDETTFELRPHEADYLRDRILSQHPRTLLAFLVDRSRLHEPVDFPWRHPQRGELPSGIQLLLDHAQNFSELAHGAPLLYNLMLAEKAGRPDLIDRYREALREWSHRLERREPDLASWSRDEFWAVVNPEGMEVPYRTVRFINRWWELVLTDALGTDIPDHPEARLLIRNRERTLKGGRARLESQRALELWSGNAGTSQLDYRWPVVQDIVRDIRTALRGMTSDARA